MDIQNITTGTLESTPEASDFWKHPYAHSSQARMTRLKVWDVGFRGAWAWSIAPIVKIPKSLNRPWAHYTEFCASQVHLKYSKGVKSAALRVAKDSSKIVIRVFRVIWGYIGVI